MLEILSLVANLTLSINPINTNIDPGTTGTAYVVDIQNAGGDPAQNVVLHMPLPPRSQIVSIATPAGWTCSAGMSEIVCTNPLMRSTDARRTERDTFRFDINLPADPDGLYFSGLATLTSDTPQKQPGPIAYTVTAMVRRMFVVTTTDDSGAGSLRDAIAAIDARCTANYPECKLTFDLPPLSRIEPLTPLPTIAAADLIVAGDRTRTSDRAVELSGRRLQSGSGLTFTSVGNGPSYGSYDVSGLAICDFPDYGITVQSSSMAVNFHGMFVGTDATGTLARPNGRGVGVFGVNVNVGLYSSIVSANRASGIWVGGTPHQTSMIVSNSLIGTGRYFIPLGNGRSGIFDANGQLRVEYSTIAYNGDAGIGMGSGADWAAMTASRVFANGTGGIDWNLDGPDAGTSPHAPPVITDARYDAAKTQTIVQGTLPNVTGDPLRYVEVFASRTRDAAGRAEGEVYAGSFYLPPTSPQTTFTAALTGDYRGQLLTATFNHGPYLDGLPVVTSEFSEPFFVSGRHRAAEK